MWRNVDGTFSNWLGTPAGGFIVNDSNALGSLTPIMHQMSGVGDFNGDGYADLLWRTPISGGDPFFRESLGTAGGGLEPADLFLTINSHAKLNGIGDFNGDGRDDVLFRFGPYVNLYFAKEGGDFAPDSLLTLSVPTEWKIAGVGDFNGDGYADLLWRNAGGALSNWLGGASGFTNNDANAFTVVGTDWTVVSTGDFNGDGRDDILWRHTSGALSNWLGTVAGGFVINDGNALTQVPLDWAVAAVGDYNGDGRDDVLWRNTLGALSDWLGTATGGFLVNDANAFTVVPVEWRIQSAESTGWHWFDPFI